MANRLYRVPDGGCHCVVADAKVGDQRLPVREIGDAGALIDTDIEFAVNEYIDVTVQFADVGDEALFAHVVSSGEDGLRLRWLHFDPAEAKRLAGTLSTFGDAHGLEAEDSDEEAAPQKAKRETRRVVRPRKTVSSSSGGEEDGDRKTRRVTKPSARMPSADGDGDAFTDADAKEAPRQPKRHETTSITPFGGSKVVSDSAPKRNTRKISKPSGTQPAVKPPVQAKGDDSPFEESGEQPAILAGTEQFRKMDSGEVKPQTVTVRKNIVGQDGKLDVGASIRSRAKTVRASELAAKHDKVRVLNMSTIKELIQDAVQEALNRLGGSIDQAEKERLLKEAEEEFQERLKAFNAEKQGWAAQQKNLESQLERAQRLLEEERNKVVHADQFTVSEQGMEDLEKRFNRLVNAAIKGNGVSGALADELQQMVANLLDSERERIAQQAMQAQSEAIALLEKKVKRLAGSLEDAEKEASRAKKRAAALEAAGGGIAGQAIFSEFEDEEDKKRKLELLKVVFDQNKEMRDQLKAKGFKVPPRKRPKPVVSQDAADVPADEVEKEGSQRLEAQGAPAAAAADAPAGPAGSEVTAAAVPEPAVGAAAAVEASAEAEAEPVSDDAYDDGVDPDDMPWVPGTKLNTEIAGDNELEDDAEEDEVVKKITDFGDVKIPSLSELRAKASGDAGDTGSEDEGASVDAAAEDGIVDTDDVSESRA